MVSKILTFLNKEFHGVNEAAVLLGFFAFLSQLLGLVRDRALAHSIGAGPMLDIYYAAFRIPDFLYISIGSLASITVLLPFLVEKMNGETDESKKAKAFMDNVFSAYMLVMIFISVVMFFVMPYLASIIAPGFSDQQKILLISTSRVMLLSPFFIGLSNLLGTVTQFFRKFFIFSLSPIFYNAGILVGIIFLYPVWGLSGLAYGVILGAFLHMIIQIPTIAQHGFFPRFIFSINWKEIRSIVSLSISRTVTLSVNSLAFIVLIALASNLIPGSISLFTFAYNLQSVPVGIIGISYSVAAFPVLVRSFSSKDMDSFMNHLIGTARQIIFWSLPVLALFIVLRAQIVRVILGSQIFSWSDTRLTAASVALFVISLATQGLVLLFVRGYYATGNTRKPLLINVFSSSMVVVLAFIFLYVFRAFPGSLSFLESILRVKGVAGTLILALPLAYALGSLLNFFLLWWFFKKDFSHPFSSDVWVTFYQSAIGAIIMGMTSYLALGVFDNIFSLSTFRGVFLQGFISGVIGISFGVFVLTMMKNRELNDLVRVLKKKFWRGRVLAPEQQEL